MSGNTLNEKGDVDFGGFGHTSVNASVFFLQSFLFLCLIPSFAETYSEENDFSFFYHKRIK